MHCPICGFAKPGLQKACPACGHAFLAAPASAPKSGFRPGRGLVRLLIYSGIVFALVQSFGRLCSSYLDAEQERAESALLSQLLEQKRRMQAAAQEIDAGGDESALAGQDAGASAGPSSS